MAGKEGKRGKMKGRAQNAFSIQWNYEKRHHTGVGMNPSRLRDDNFTCNNSPEAHKVTAS